MARQSGAIQTNMNTTKTIDEGQSATPEKQRTLTTRLHRYHFNLTNEAGQEAWKQLESELKAKGLKRFHAWGGTPPTWTDKQEATEQVEIEVSCIFDNQWNTTKERVFDWFQYYEINGPKCARGHWLEITTEMQEAREKTVKCGYCGKHYGIHHEPAPVDGFCQACLDSPYLKESDLYLLRLVPVSDKRNYNQKLTQAESESLLPRYVSRQTTGADSRSKKRRDDQRARVIEKAQEETENATTERDGMLWLWDKGLDLDNVIFYGHTRKFSFGWRSPLAESVASKLLDVLTEFPFEYELKREV